jgi:calreticulin
MIEDDWAFPKKMIKDPAQSKPADWVEEKMIPDPDAVKPAGYDDIPAEIPDPEAEKPDDWDEEDDGAWEAPLIDNPEYKGVWKAPLIENPAYKGEWEHPMIPNPNYSPGTCAKYSTLNYVGFELWTVNPGSIFDNVLVTDDVDYAKKMAKETYHKIVAGEKDAKDAYTKANAPEMPDEPEDEDELPSPDLHDEL